MELKFIGRGAAFNAEEGNTNAYFVENETLFLLDCGEGMFAHLKTHNILNKIKEVYVYISHKFNKRFCEKSMGIFSEKFPLK